MGRAYLNLDLLRSPRASSLFTRAADIRRRVLGPDDPATLLSLEGEAQSLSTAADVEFRTAAQQTPRLSAAEKLEHDAVTTEKRILGPNHPQTLDSITTEAVLMRTEGKEAESARLLERNLEAERRILGGDHPDTLRTLPYRVRARSGTEAEHAAREEYETRRRLLGRDHPDTQVALEDLTDALAGEERYADASSLQDAEVTRQRETFGLMHLPSPRLVSDLVEYLGYQHRYSDAETVLRRHIEVVQNEERRGTLPRLWYELAAVQTEMGNKDDALRSLKHALGLGFITMAGQGSAADHHFAALKGDSRFQALVEENERNLRAGRKRVIVE